MSKLKEEEFELPPRIQRRIREVLISLGCKKPRDVRTNHELHMAFVWASTPEEHDFWSSIYAGDYRKFDRRYPGYDDSPLEDPLENLFKL